MLDPRRDGERTPARVPADVEPGAAPPGLHATEPAAPQAFPSGGPRCCGFFSFWRAEHDASRLAARVGGSRDHRLRPEPDLSARATGEGADASLARRAPRVLPRGP